MGVTLLSGMQCVEELAHCRVVCDSHLAGSTIVQHGTRIFVHGWWHAHVWDQPTSRYAQQPSCLKLSEAVSDWVQDTWRNSSPTCCPLSHTAAVAALVVSLFPRMPSSTMDHRCHLQACFPADCCSGVSFGATPNNVIHLTTVCCCRHSATCMCLLCSHGVWMPSTSTQSRYGCQPGGAGVKRSRPSTSPLYPAGVSHPSCLDCCCCCRLCMFRCKSLWVVTQGQLQATIRPSYALWRA